MLKALTLPAPKPIANKATVIFLHGLGDSGAGWADAAEMWQQSLPHIKFILPHAPVMPITLNGGMPMPGWHDIQSLDSIDAENFKGLEGTIGSISGIIDDEIKAGTEAERIVLGGFSQGAATAVMTGFQFHKKLAGVVGMSG